MYIVKLWDKCWIAPWSGDPGRTVVEENAKRYESEKSAIGAARQVLRYKKSRAYMKPTVIKIES